MTKSELRAELARLSKDVPVTVVPAKEIPFSNPARATVKGSSGCRAGGIRLGSFRAA